MSFENAFTASILRSNVSCCEAEVLIHGPVQFRIELLSRIVAITGQWGHYPEVMSGVAVLDPN